MGFRHGGDTWIPIPEQHDGDSGIALPWWHRNSGIGPWHTASGLESHFRLPRPRIGIVDPGVGNVNTRYAIPEMGWRCRYTHCTSCIRIHECVRYVHSASRCGGSIGADMRVPGCRNDSTGVLGEMGLTYPVARAIMALVAEVMHTAHTTRT